MLKKIYPFVLLMAYPLVFLIWAARVTPSAGLFYVFSDQPGERRLTYLLAYAACAGCYIALLAARKRLQNMRLFCLWLCFAAVALAAIWIPPTSSCDIYYYVSHSLIQGRLQLNTYTTTINELPPVAKSFAAASGFTRRTPMSYGYLTAAWLHGLYYVARGSESAIFILIKLSTTLGLVLLFVLLRKLIGGLTAAGDQRDPLEPLEPPTSTFDQALDVRSARQSRSQPRDLFVLVLLNPVLITQFIINGHNDSLMSAGVAAGMLALARRRPALAVLGFCAALHIKSAVVFALPFVALYLLRQRLRVSVVLALLLLVVASFVPYAAVYGLRGLPAGIAVYRTNVDASFPGVAFAILQRFVPLSWAAFHRALNYYALIYFGVLAVFMFWMWKRATGGYRVLFHSLELVYAVYLLFFAQALYPWYILWLLPFAVVRQDAAARILAYSITFFWLDIYFTFLTRQVWAMFAFIPLTAGLPLALWLLLRPTAAEAAADPVTATRS